MAKSKKAIKGSSRNSKTKKIKIKSPGLLSRRVVMIISVTLFALVGTWLLNRIFAAESYQLIWSDEFNGTSLDTSKWGVYHNTYGDGNNEIACLTPNNTVVSNGTLKIVAKRESITCPNSTTDQFSSGFISTRSIGGSGSGTTSKGKFFPMFARYEMRAKIPHGQGLWPAFWLRHKSGSSIAEVDVMEYFHTQIPGKTTSTIHLDKQKNVDKKAVAFENVTDTPGWHTWAVEITPDVSDSSKAHFNFLLDGTSFLQTTPSQQEWTKDGDANAMFDIAVNMAIGGNYVGHPDDDLGYSRWLETCLKPYRGNPPCDSSGIRRTSFPENFEVDYVRVYTKQATTDPGDGSGGTGGSGGGNTTNPPPSTATLSTPTNLGAVASDGKVTLTWDNISGANNYTVRWGTGGSWSSYSNESGNSNNPTANIYTIEGLNNGTTYNFSVAARDSTGTLGGSDYSGAVTATPVAPTTTTPVPTKLLTPTNVQAASNDRSVTLTWNSVEGANNYTVRWGTGGSWSSYSNESGNSNNPTANIYTIEGLNNGTTYNFSVAARDSSGLSTGSDYSGPVNSVPVAANPISSLVPQNLRLEVSSKKITASWDEVSDDRITAYEVRYIRSDSSSKNNPSAWTYPGRTTFTKYEITRLSNGVEYDVQVRAIATKNTTTSYDDEYSNYSETDSGTPNWYRSFWRRFW